MDGEQTLENKDEKQRAWTIDEIRKNSANWTLAGDVGLFNLLNEFSHNIISRTHEVENAVDSLVHQTKMASAKINNIISDFHMLSNLQFVENRVYDEEVQETVPEEKLAIEKTKEQKEAEMLPKIIKAVELGLAVLDQAFDKINVNEISDSDDEDLSSEGRTILEPKDPYEHRPLPFVIGSSEFQNCDHAGLKDLIEDEIESSIGEESSISESDETSSDEEELLPAEDEKFSVMQNHKFPAQSISDRLSSSEESELFGSEKEENDFASDSSFESKKKEGKNIQRPDIEVKVEEKETRQNSISSLQSKLNLPQVLPVKQKEKDLFANDDEISDEESPFRKKSSLFASDVNFGEEKDDIFGGDLFGESIKKSEKVQKSESPKVSHIPNNSSIAPKTKQLDLFANDEDSEEDIFNTLMKTKTPTSKGSNTGSQDLSEKAESSSTPSSAPSTKPSGNAFDFVTGGGNTDSLFGDESDADDLFTKKKQEKKFDFDAFDDDDDLFGITSNKSNKTAKKSEVKKSSKPTEKKLSLFSDSDSFDEANIQSKASTAKPISLFEDNDSFEPSSQSKLSSGKTVSLFEDSNNDQKSTADIEKPLSSKPSKKVKNSFFEDSGSDQEIISVPKPVPAQAAVKVPEKSLFDDDDEEDDNIFSQVSKKPSSKETVPPKQKPENSKKAPAVTKTPIDSIFDESLKTNVKHAGSNEVPKTNDLGLFDSVSEEQKEDFSFESNKENDTKKSLFDDSDNFDLFAPKSPKRETDPVDEPKQLPQPDKISVPETTDELGSSNIKSKNSTSILAASNIENSGVGFDMPIDSSKTLNVIGKDRVKVATKRRLPTRKGRLAALETAEQESKVEEPKPQDTVQNTNVPKEELFSEPPTAVPPSAGASYKAQEKKKMDIMSQLISEVSASKVGKKNLFQNDADDEEEVDIFAEATSRSETKKQSFSFLPPKESSIDSGFLNETKGSSEAKSNTTEVDDAAENDEFFVEPSFKTFRSSVSRADSVLNLSDDEDDDLFSAIKSNSVPQAKTDGSDVNDLLDDSDIFADIQKEKYELFPTQLYDNEDDDDIFGSLEPTTNGKSDNTTNKNKTVKKIETRKVDAFEDPLTGLLGED